MSLSLENWSSSVRREYSLNTVVLEATETI
jgi:hypothetical protein